MSDTGLRVDVVAYSVTRGERTDVVMAWAAELGPRGGVQTYAVPCECGVVFEVAARTYRDLRNQGRMPKCWSCQRQTVKPTSRHQKFWLEHEDHFTMDQIVEMAEALFGPRDTWPVTAHPHELAIAASAA